MYREQLQSQANIVRLVNNEVESLTFGAADESAETAESSRDRQVQERVQPFRVR